MPVITPGLYPVVRPGVSVGVESPGTSPGQIGRPGPARAGLARLRPRFQRTQARETATSVTATGAVLWEALGTSLAVTATSPWEALLGLAPVQLIPWDATGNPTTTFGIRGRIGARSLGQIGS